MTRHDVDVLAFFVANWKLLNNNQGLRSCLKLDLADYCEKNCLHFDRERYWNTMDGIAHDKRAREVVRAEPESDLCPDCGGSATAFASCSNDETPHEDFCPRAELHDNDPAKVEGEAMTHYLRSGHDPRD